MSLGIFLADDELNVRHALRLLLEQAGYKIAGESGEAESMLVKIQASPPAVILLDWELPSLNAQCFMAALGRGCPGTKVIALSARPDARLEALAVGVDAFVSKGNPPEDLLAALRKITQEAPLIVSPEC